MASLPAGGKCANCKMEYVERKIGTKMETRTGTKIKLVRKIFIGLFSRDFQCGISSYIFLNSSLFFMTILYINFSPLLFYNLYSVAQKSSTDVQVLPYNLLVSVRTISPSPAFVCVCVCVCLWV